MAGLDFRRRKFAKNETIQIGRKSKLVDPDVVFWLNI